MLAGHWFATARRSTSVVATLLLVKSCAVSQEVTAPPEQQSNQAGNRPGAMPTHSDTEDEEALLQWHPTDTRARVNPNPERGRPAKLKTGSNGKQQTQAKQNADHEPSGSHSVDTAVPSDSQALCQSGANRKAAAGYITSSTSATASQLGLPVHSTSAAPASTPLPQLSQLNLSSVAQTSCQEHASMPPAAQVAAISQAQQRALPSNRAALSSRSQLHLLPNSSAAMPSLTTSWDSSTYSSCIDYVGSSTSGVASASAVASGSLTDRSDVSIWPLADAAAMTGHDLHKRLQKLEAEVSFSSLVSSHAPVGAEAGLLPRSGTATVQGPWPSSAAAPVGLLPKSEAARAGPMPRPEVDTARMSTTSATPPVALFDGAAADAVLRAQTPAGMPDDLSGQTLTDSVILTADPEL